MNIDIEKIYGKHSLLNKSHSTDNEDEQYEGVELISINNESS